MATREDLLEFSKKTSLSVVDIDDDSSGGEEGVEVKILNLSEPVAATASIPAPDGTVIRLRDNRVWVVAGDIDEFLKNAVKKDGLLVYSGPMHLDVSKPAGRMVGGNYTITKPAKIWLRVAKFSRSGNTQRLEGQKHLGTAIKNMFGSGVFDMTVPANAGAATPVVNTGGTGGAGGKVDPEVVGNKQAAGAGKVK